MSEDFGVYGSDPRSKVDPMLDRAWGVKGSLCGLQGSDLH